jgi:hypothetical protein
LLVAVVVCSKGEAEAEAVRKLHLGVLLVAAKLVAVVPTMALLVQPDREKALQMMEVEKGKPYLLLVYLRHLLFFLSMIHPT